MRVKSQYRADVEGRKRIVLHVRVRADGKRRTVIKRVRLHHR